MDDRFAVDVDLKIRLSGQQANSYGRGVASRLAARRVFSTRVEGLETH